MYEVVQYCSSATGWAGSLIFLESNQDGGEQFPHHIQDVTMILDTVFRRQCNCIRGPSCSCVCRFSAEVKESSSQSTSLIGILGKGKLDLLPQWLLAIRAFGLWTIWKPLLLQEEA